MNEDVVVRFIIQIAGKPVQNVEKALSIVEEKLGESQTFKLKESQILEAQYDEESSLYSGLIEGVAKFDDLEKLFEFILDYTPNSIEVEEPEHIKLDAARLTGMLNEFSNKILSTTNQVRTLSANLHFLSQKVRDFESKDKKKKKL